MKRQYFLFYRMLKWSILTPVGTLTSYSLRNLLFDLPFFTIHPFANSFRAWEHKDTVEEFIQKHKQNTIIVNSWWWELNFHILTTCKMCRAAIWPYERFLHSHTLCRDSHHKRRHRNKFSQFMIRKRILISKTNHFFGIKKNLHYDHHFTRNMFAVCGMRTMLWILCGALFVRVGIESWNRGIA